MFKYINMPSLVAQYLKEFSVRSDRSTSQLYKFVLCLCLPFVSDTFYRARMIALAIAECTASSDQIVRVMNKITGATILFIEGADDYECSYDGTGDLTSQDFPYTSTVENFADSPIVTYTPVTNAGNMIVDLNGYSQEQFESYLTLLIPFYSNYKITYI